MHPFLRPPQKRLIGFVPRLLAAAGALLLATGAVAAPHTLTLDPQTTEVGFLLEATGHDVEGHLVFDSGSLVLEPDVSGSGGAASGELVLDARGTETGNTKRDKKMHKEVLVSQLHPRIVFTPESYDGAFPNVDGGELTLHGQVELLGQRHPLDLAVAYRLDGERFEADVTFDVPFIAWGLEDPSILFLRVDKVVHVHADTAGTWRAPAVAEAREAAAEANADAAAAGGR